jgi:FHA domain-containing protein
VPAPRPSPRSPAASPPPRASLPEDFDPFAVTSVGKQHAHDPAAGQGRRDPFGDLLGRSAHAGSTGAGSAKDPIVDLMPQAQPSIDELFGLGGSTAGAPGRGRDIIGDFLSETPTITPSRDGDPPVGREGARAGSPSAAPRSLDPLELFAPPASPSPPAPVTVLPDHTPELRAAYRPPEVRPAKPAAEPAAPVEGPSQQAARASAPRPLLPEPAVPTPRAAAVQVPSSAPSVPRAGGGEGGDAQALWRAFEQGAGIGRLPDEALTPELMGIVGRLLRTSVDGTLRLMAARTATKQELRAQVTVIQSHDNNPLKFTPDPQAALEQLLRPPVRGFMPGTDAVQDAMDDLLAHAVGTMAGMRAALQGVLARFTPSQLEAALSEPSMLDKLLPMNRHAKLWELYLAHHARVKGDAEDRFDSLFGAAFVQAYEEQLEELARARTRRAADAPPDAPRPRPDAA